jgi:hypothetical protein
MRDRSHGSASFLVSDGDTDGGTGHRDNGSGAVAARWAWRVDDRVKRQHYAALVVQGYGRDTHVLFHVKHVSKGTMEATVHRGFRARVDSTK